MKIGYETVTWRGAKLQQSFEDIACAGFSYVEMHSIDAVEIDESDIVKYLKEYNLQLIAAYFGGSYIDENFFKYELLDFEGVCHFLQKSGSAYIVVGGGMRKPGGNSPEDYHVLAKALEEMGHRAVRLDLKLCYHPHRGTMVQFPKQIEMIAELTDPELVSFCFDTAHLASGGGDPVELCRKYSERLAYVHFKDIDNRGKFVELGSGGKIDFEGKIDFKRVWAVLQEIGFDAPLAVELDASVDPRESCERNKRYLETVLEITV
jgi:inosose dehydratase